MDTGEALTGMIQLAPLVIFSALSFWRMHPVLFMFCGGVAVITGCYIPDIINGGVTDNLSLTAGLAMMFYGMVCFAFAFKTMFYPADNE